jgi:hypothetical protein
MMEYIGAYIICRNGILKIIYLFIWQTCVEANVLQYYLQFHSNWQ